MGKMMSFVSLCGVLCELVWGATPTKKIKIF
jgi:hypothetical protein